MKRNKSGPAERGFPAFYREDSRILILGSFPSPISRKERFYYANPRNRFWRVLSEVYREKIPETLSQKEDFLARHGLALCDVVERCFIRGADDASIEKVAYSDLSPILKASRIQRIYCLGKTAFRLFEKRYGKGKASLLPSTSPANAAMSLAALVSAFEVALLARDTPEG